jgi:DNA-binding response OmpR family regulator
VPSVLVISAVKGIADRYKVALEHDGYQVVTACGLQEAVLLNRDSRFDAVLIGPYMADKAAVLAAIRSANPLIRVLALLREKEREVPGAHCLRPAADAASALDAVTTALKQ